MAEKFKKLHAVGDDDNNPATETSTAPGIAKPAAFDLNRFKSKRGSTPASIGTLLTGLPHYPISDARDFVRLHPNEDEFWSFELCFVSIPVKGEKRDLLHLIDDDIAGAYLPPKKVQRFRLALGTKPHDVFFLAHVPTQNLDNSWNATNLDACEKAKLRWVQATSLKAEGIDKYKINYTKDEDPFPEPRWPTQTLAELITVTFADGRMIDREDHPGLLRLLGAKQSLS